MAAVAWATYRPSSPPQVAVQAVQQGLYSTETKEEEETVDPEEEELEEEKAEKILSDAEPLQYS